MPSPGTPELPFVGDRWEELAQQDSGDTEPEPDESDGPTPRVTRAASRSASRDTEADGPPEEPEPDAELEHCSSPSLWQPEAEDNERDAPSHTSPEAPEAPLAQASPSAANARTQPRAVGGRVISPVPARYHQPLSGTLPSSAEGLGERPTPTAPAGSTATQENTRQRRYHTPLRSSAQGPSAERGLAHILEEAHSAEDGTPLYRVRWPQRGASADTWDSADCLPSDMLERYRHKHG